MRHARLLLLALTLLLALPPSLVGTYPAVDSRVPDAPGFAAPQHAKVTGNAPGLDARRRGDRKARRRQARNAERKERRERQRRGQSAEQARIAAKVEAAPPRLPALAEDNPCGPGLTQLPQSRRCTHGPDDLPSAGSTAPGTGRIATADSQRNPANAACDGDGTSGFRVQVLYLRSSSGTDHYDEELGNIRDWAEGASTILRNSSLAAAGQEMGFTYVMTPDCEIDVQNVVLSPAAIRSFDATIVTLDQQGYDQIDRIYLLFADTNTAGICGIGTMWWDDSALPSNDNNRGPSYARADRECWSAHTAAHELMHNLGGVQRTAPNTTGYGHCIDEYDVMCYPDDARARPLRYDCKPQSTYEYLYDCHNDDYFNPSPAPSTYLASHWNTANNWFLTRDIPPDADLIRPDVTWVAPVGNGQTHVASAGVIPLRTNVTDASGVAYVDFWLYDEIRDTWIPLGTDFAPPYTSSVNVSTLNSGLNYVLADAYDTHHNLNEEGIWIERSGNVTPSAISLATSTARVKAKKRVTLTAAVANAPAGSTSVEFRFCRGGSCTWTAGKSLGVGSSATPSISWKASGKGRVTFLAQVTSVDGPVTSNPVTVSVKKVKKRH